MTFDEFLTSNEGSYTYEENYSNSKSTVIKIKYDDFLDFIYKPSWGELIYGNDLKFLGIFDKINKKLYGSSYDLEHSRNLISNYYIGEISKIDDSLQKDFDNLLMNYIETNKTKLMELSQHIFDKYISLEDNHNEFKKVAVHDYIYSNPIEDFKFNADVYERNKDRKPIILDYLKNQEKVATEKFSNYINNKENKYTIYSRRYGDAALKISNKEYIGFTILKQNYIKNLIEGLKSNPNNEYRKTHDILNSIKDLDAQNINITVKHNGEEITFKYPKSSLYHLNLLSWRIPDVETRNKVKELYFDKHIYDDFYLEDIILIEYKKQAIYEDKELALKNDIQENIAVEEEYNDY